MHVSESQDGRCRCIYWTLPDSDWIAVSESIDPFLSHAIRGIAAEYANEPVEWLEINHWPDSGRVMVFPSQEGPWGDRAERLYFELSSRHLENEFMRISESLPEREQEAAWQALGNRLWGQVGASLRDGEGSRQLAEARKVHRLRLAAFDFNFAEGLFHLIDLDEEAAAEMYRMLET